MTISADQANLAVNTVRSLSIDAVQQANSGHPGLPLGFAPVAYLLYAEEMRHNPADPFWPNRDRFILSPGHGSAMLYATLHLAGYDLSLEDLKGFRSWGSKTPGHPEFELHGGKPLTPGVEVTTGPLGQGFANGVGMAIAERFLSDKFGSDLVDHYTYAVVSDGDLMEGISYEAAALAGHLQLGKLIYLYDDNEISLDGPTSLSFSENVPARFAAAGWHTVTVDDANDLDALRKALAEARAETGKPSLISVKSIIGFGAPGVAGTKDAHGAPLGADGVKATKQALGLNPELLFNVPDGVYDAFKQHTGVTAQLDWQNKLDALKQADPQKFAEWEAAQSGQVSAAAIQALKDLPAEKEASRVSGKRSLAAFAPHVPTFMGGAADLASSTGTVIPGSPANFTATESGPNLHFGVREHAMGAVVNGMAAHGGIVRPFGSTFLQFADYMRGAIRLSALQNLKVAWVFTHDSVAVGEDGPTHQPVEHVMALRAIPNLVVFRPADSTETAAAWAATLDQVDGPVLFALSRQGMAVLECDGGQEAIWKGVAKGGYVVSEGGDKADRQVTLVGTGSEVGVAIKAQQQLKDQGVQAAVVSLPSWELFAQQSDEYRASVIPVDVPSVSVEAGVKGGWSQLVDASISIDRFGASAPGDEVLTKLGITAEAVAESALALIGN